VTFYQIPRLSLRVKSHAHYRA